MGVWNTSVVSVGGRAFAHMGAIDTTAKNAVVMAFANTTACVTRVKNVVVLVFANITASVTSAKNAVVVVFANTTASVPNAKNVEEDQFAYMGADELGVASVVGVRYVCTTASVTGARTVVVCRKPKGHCARFNAHWAESKFQVYAPLQCVTPPSVRSHHLVRPSTITTHTERVARVVRLWVVLHVL